MSLYLLDTDAVIDLLKNVRETVSLVQGLHSRSDTLCTSGIVLGEVFSGLHAHDRTRAETLLSGLLYLTTTAEAARRAGEWRYDYARRGQQTAITDCLIAATAVDHAAVLVSGNAKDFPMPEVTLLPLPRPGRRGSR